MRSINGRISRPINNQRGLSFGGWLVVILIVGIVLMQLFKLFPAYAESLTLSSEMKKIAELDGGVERLSNREIRTRLQNFFRVNSVSKEASDSLKVTRSEGRVLVDMAYERRVEMFYNIDAVLSFHYQIDSKSPQECCTVSD